jgi:hypothetical protein
MQLKVTLIPERARCILSRSPARLTCLPRMGKEIRRPLRSSYEFRQPLVFALQGSKRARERVSFHLGSAEPEVFRLK